MLNNLSGGLSQGLGQVLFDEICEVFGEDLQQVVPQTRPSRCGERETWCAINPSTHTSLSWVY